jgi:hypothetical protein
MQDNLHQYDAYALGYYHGRGIGSSNNPYAGTKDPEGKLSHYYRLGYDRGVADYSQYITDVLEHN